ncbi:MAG: hypothetical protein IKL20_00660 [Alistipes sp.]|nr:hypothetical protein [Alistipes sp.]
MKRYLLLLTLFVCFFYNLSAQSVSIERIMSDTDMKDYVWAIGYGMTLEEADKNAINTLASHDASITLVNKSKLEDKLTTTGHQSAESTSINAASVSNMYLENVRREVLTDQEGQKRVLRYISRKDWEARYSVLKSKIEEYIESGKYASLVEDKLRYYTWANVLLQTYPNHHTPISVDGVAAKQWLLSQLRDILTNIKVSVILVEKDKENRNYPYKLYLDFVYDEEPIGYLRFGYFDGRSFTENESVKDGRGVIQMSQLPSELKLEINCVNKELARQMDPSVYVLLQGAGSATFEEAKKVVPTAEKKDVVPQKEVDTTAKSTESVVNQKLEESQKSYVEIKERVESPVTYDNIMKDVVASISSKEKVEIEQHFEPEAWEQYQKIVASGNPTLARTPEFNFIRHDTLTICQSLPLKLRFHGNHSFVEDVVFRVNNRTHKVESVAYKLGAKTEKSIMAMDWDDAARLTLIAFLEDYRTAYCLKNLDYINKVFAEDAYIIVGRVLKQSTRKFADTPYSIQGTKTVYSRQTKREYISHLRQCFLSKEFVNIRFEECTVARGHGAKEGVYAVQVRQLYYSNNYADDGILTLAIDMRNDVHPLVRVRVWHQERDVFYTAEEMIARTVSVYDGL